MLVYLRHAREIGYCNKGIRQFCVRYNLSWEDMLHNGVSKEILLKTDNAMADKLVKHVEDSECL